MNYKKYPIRKCRSLHYCNICKRNITDGQLYYDGGYNKRCHVSCIEPDDQYDEYPGGYDSYSLSQRANGY
jgi:hypothetical protein